MVKAKKSAAQVLKKKEDFFNEWGCFLLIKKGLSTAYGHNEKTTHLIFKKRIYMHLNQPERMKRMRPTAKLYSRSHEDFPLSGEALAAYTIVQ